MSMVCVRWVRCLVIPLLVSVALSVCARAETQQYEGKRIVEVQFSPPEQPVATSDLLQAMTLKRGSPLEMADVRKSIENLFATGRYQDIQVEAELRGDGVVIRFRTKNTWFVGRVLVTGNVSQPPNRAQMVSATRLTLGQPFREDNLGQAEQGARALLVADGYYENRIHSRIEYDPGTQQAHVHFIVESGPRAKYRTPALLGELQMAVEKIVAATKWKRRWVEAGVR